MKKLWYSAIALAISLSLVCLPVLAQEAPLRSTIHKPLLKMRRYM